MCYTRENDRGQEMVGSIICFGTLNSLGCFLRRLAGYFILNSILGLLPNVCPVSMLLVHVFCYPTDSENPVNSGFEFNLSFKSCKYMKSERRPRRQGFMNLGRYRALQWI